MKGAVVLLAAGASRRLGRPKQLLDAGGAPLCRRAAEVALAAGLDAVHVVVGSHADEVEASLLGLPIAIVYCAEWERGMSVSLGAGLSSLAATTDFALVTLCDQPRVSSDHLRRLVTEHEERGTPMVASRYDGRLGVPALFARDVWPELLALDGAEGAQRVLRRDPSRVAVVDAPEAAIDIDTEDDVRAHLAGYDLTC